MVGLTRQPIVFRMIELVERQEVNVVSIQHAKIDMVSQEEGKGLRDELCLDERCHHQNYSQSVQRRESDEHPANAPVPKARSRLGSSSMFTFQHGGIDLRAVVALRWWPRVMRTKGPLKSSMHM